MSALQALHGGCSNDGRAVDRGALMQNVNKSKENEMHTGGLTKKLRVAIGLMMLAISGCATPDFSDEGLPSKLDATLAAHPYALEGCPAPALDLVDDLIQTWRAWEG